MMNVPFRRFVAVVAVGSCLALSASRTAPAAVGTLADSSGELVAWGYNFYGQTNVPAGTYTAVTGGGAHSLALRSDGTLAGWGDNSVGQTNVPAGTYTAVAGGSSHSLALRSDGTLAGWGYNGSGQTNVPAGTYTAVEAGSSHSLAVRSDGTLAGWGYNGDGQTNVPAGTYTAVAAGDAHSLALRSDGTLAGWGNNFYGQTNVPAGTYTAVAAGFSHSLALRRDGTLAGWGYNFYGQTNVPAGTYTAVAAGGNHSLALRARTVYGGEGLLISGTGVTANLNRSVQVYGDLTVRNTTAAFYNDPQATVYGRLVVDGGTFSGTGFITTQGIDLRGNFSLPGSVTIVNTGPITGTGNLHLLSNSRLSAAIFPGNLYSGGTTIDAGAAFAFTGRGQQLAGSLNLASGGELRLEGGQGIRFSNAAGGTNAGSIQLLGDSPADPAEIEFQGSYVNAASTGFITGRHATMRFQGGLTNGGSVALSRGLNDVFGDITNSAGSTVTVTGGADAVFYDDIIQNGTFRVARVGSLTSTAIVFGAFTGSGGSNGGGNIFFEGDLRPGNSPASVTFANNVSLGSGANTVIELAGATPGTQYDQIHVTGDLALGGALNVSLLDNFTPSAGQSFDILDWNSLSGTFANINLPALANGLSWNTSQLYTSGVLSVTSPRLPGDIDEDGDVDRTDASLFTPFLGRATSTWTTGDFNNDGLTTLADLALLQSNLGMTTPSPSATAAVPEPATWALALLAFPLLLRRRITASPASAAAARANVDGSGTGLSCVAKT